MSLSPQQIDLTASISAALLSKQFCIAEAAFSAITSEDDGGMEATISGNRVDRVE